MFSCASHQILASQKIVEFLCPRRACEFVFTLRCQMNNTMSARKSSNNQKSVLNPVWETVLQGEHHDSEPGQDNINALRLCVCVRAHDQMNE